MVYIGHCIVRTPSIYGFWLLLWYILVIVLSVRRLFTASDYFFGIFYPLYCPYFVYLRLLITPLVYFGHCIVRTSSIYDLWLLLLYILVIVLSVLRLFTASDNAFGIFWSLYCPYSVYLRLLITSLVYFGHCIVRTSSIYASDYFFGIFCPFYWSYSGQFTAYDYSFSIFWLLYCPYFICGMFWSLYCSYFIYGIFWSLYCPYFTYGIF